MPILKRTAFHLITIGKKMVKILNTRKIEKRIITKNRQMRKIISYINQAKLKIYKNYKTKLRDIYIMI